MDSEYSDRFLSTIQIKERVKDILTEYRLQIFLSRQQIYNDVLLRRKSILLIIIVAS